MNQNKKPKWYVVHTYAAHEDKVKSNLEKIVENRGIKHLIHEIKIPTHNVVVINKDNKKVTKEQKLYPSYVIIKMIITDESWFIVRNTRGVTGFVGTGTDPIPLSDSEVIAMGLETTEIELDYNVGDIVKVVSGPFAESTCEIFEIDTKKLTMKVKINFLGGDTPAELKFSDVAKL
ncbi:MAG: transcription termination/antitermination factor NusG [Clostridiales bacterium]|nr:MAG: transcription termination/antitermination factor NusG [Clostridiales bacterium]